MWRLALFVTVLAANIKGLQITSLQVPPFVVNNSGLVVLDCQYSLTPVDLQQDSGLVVKWFFNNGPAPVFQWIPGQRPQDLGILKGRLDLDYQVSNDNATMYRALSLVNPTTELSGEYRCAVSTFADEDFMIQKMIVYAPEKYLELLQEKPTYDSVNISCSGFGLYPEPRIALYKDPYTPRKSEPLRGMTVETSSKHGHYDIVATSLFQDADLAQDILTTFICEVCIPTTEYCPSKHIVYYPEIPLHSKIDTFSEPLRGVTVETSSKHGHYDIVATSLFQDADLSQDILTTFVCEVCIPTTEYCPFNRIVYYPDTPLHSKIDAFSEPLRGVTVETSSKHGHYDIVATSLFQDADLAQDIPTTFICEVCILTTEYCRSKRIVYYPDTPLHRSMASYYAEGCGVRSGSIITWLAILSLLVLK